ncbi:MAG: MATE family efflux transporter [Rhizobiaceae bacterium]|nr:MATE family efflux transporter [Rhizobiaceae bacterium]MCV0405911.1 MATE family efflux transporter [Rhizobiaceae bacterium]
MTIAYLTTPLLGLVDTAVVGRLGDAALLGGLAAGAIVFDVAFATFNFLRTGTAGLVAQAYGRADRAEEQAVFWRAFAIAIISGLLLIALTGPILWAGTAFIGGEAAVREAMALYVGIRLLCAPSALVNYAVLGYVLGRGEAGLGLALQALVNGVNIALSIWLGLVLGWGIAGVAWGTVIAETLGAIVGLVIIVVRFGRLGRVPRAMLTDLTAFRRMAAVNRDIMIRSFVLLGAFALFARQGAQQGTLVLAANAVLMNLFLVAGYFLDGIATAAEQLAGRAVGARWRPAFDRTVRLTGVWGFALAGLATMVFMLFGEQLIALMTTSPEVRGAALAFLPWAAATALTGVLAFQMDGIFIGTTWSSDMRNCMLASLVVYVAAIWLLQPVFGNHGLWAALHVFLIMRGLTLAALVPRRAEQTLGPVR